MLFAAGLYIRFIRIISLLIRYLSKWAVAINKKGFLTEMFIIYSSFIYTNLKTRTLCYVIIVTFFWDLQKFYVYSKPNCMTICPGQMKKTCLKTSITALWVCKWPTKTTNWTQEEKVLGSSVKRKFLAGCPCTGSLFTLTCICIITQII